MSNAKILARLKQNAVRQGHLIATCCGLMLLALVFFSLKGCKSADEPESPGSSSGPPAHGTLKISENVEKLVLDSLAEDIVFIENVETQELIPLVLTPERTMQLPLGKYRLRTIWEVESDEPGSKSSDGAQFRFRAPNFTIRDSHSGDHPLVHAMTFQLLTPSWKHPMLPAAAGATTTWQGKFDRNPGSKDESSVIDYTLTITTLNVELIDQFPCRWLRVEVETSSALAPTVTETAFLALDTREWETNQDFVVRRGWIQATSEDIRTELETYASAGSLKANGKELPPLQQLTLKFDPARDVIAKKATDLEAPFPENRLSLLDVLSLVMDADLEGASKIAAAMRVELSDLRVSFDKDFRNVNDGSLSCLAVRSQIVADDLQFQLLRNDIVVPFSLVEVEIKHPLLEASLTLSKRFLPEADHPVAPVDEVQLASEADQLEALPRKTRFDLAAIPKEDGVQVDYTGSLTESGPGSGISYNATVSTLATEARDGLPCRWLKVEVTTRGSGEAMREAAIVLVDPADYESTHKASILDGWLIYGNDEEHVLPFDLQGDMKQTDEDRQMLEVRLPEKRLSIHDVLALLFNAELRESPSRFIQLRGRIEGDIHNSTGRKMTRQELKLKDSPAIPGKVWTFKNADGGPLDYTFKRSEKIPFSVFSMDLTYGPVKLSTRLNSYGISKEAPASFDLSEWTERAETTQNRIVAWKEDHPNYHFWTIKPKPDAGEQEKARLLAEWAGYGKPQGKAIKRAFFLKPYDALWTDALAKRVKDGQIAFPADAELSEECLVWIEEGRHWIQNQPTPSQYFPERSAPEKHPDGILVKVSVQDPGERILFKELDKEDQDWVNRVHANSLKN